MRKATQGNARATRRRGTVRRMDTTPNPAARDRWPSPDRSALEAFFGRHETDPATGKPTAAWEAAHLADLAPPYPMVLAWAPGVAVRTIRCHRLVAGPLERVLRAVARHFGDTDALRRAGMHLYGGAYCYRPVRGGRATSLHAWGAAIDLDPARNPLGRAHGAAPGMMPPAVVRLFEAEGWAWGGRFSRPDCMHFEAVRRG